MARRPQRETTSRGPKKLTLQRWRLDSISMRHLELDCFKRQVCSEPVRLFAGIGLD